MADNCNHCLIGFSYFFAFAIVDFKMKIPGVGPAFATRLEKLGIFTEKDFLYHIPSRYDDFSVVSKIANIQEGETVTVRGKILEIKNIFTRSSYVLQKAVIEDDTGKLPVVWFNQRFLTRVIFPGDPVSLSGKINKHQFESPQYEIGSSIHTGRLVPVYPETEGISSKWFRSKIYFLLKNLNLKDYLPAGEFMELNEAIQKVHFPDSLEQARQAKRRLAFDELLMAQIEAKSRKVEWQKKTVGNKFKNLDVKLDLPFELTDSQKKVIKEIFFDLQKEVPMNRLLQGDVGSGKTIVAAFAMLAANLNGYQAAIMAPTELLANQHFETLSKLGLTVGIATGSIKDYKNKDIIVGTHALFSSDINFKNLGLIVIDEQHRFGVEQRAALTAKGVNPHVLTMTATPIPRTIALTLYGDLDLSVLTELPKNRLPIKTWVVPEHKREAAYQWIEKQKTQTFVICPFIEESETLQTVKAAKTEFENIKKIFKNLRVGLVHGKLKNKDKVLNDFRNQKLDILVATPIVEVGIDIPQATIMVIEGADRFGLAQLHQLRGRVGRGDQQSYCLLFGENISRLKLLEKINNGMQLAEADLRFRGPGHRFGTAQHGRWDLKIADFSDLGLVEQVNDFLSCDKYRTHVKLLYDTITKKTSLT